MNLNNADIVFTAGLPSQLPGDIDFSIPQIAMCGRSNVGKSSLINKLLGRKHLARVSGEPGKTITINYYNVDNSLYLVDLPGYGYAKRSFDEREKWSKLINKYFSTEGKKLYLQLVDLKVGLTKDDITMLNFLNKSNFPFAIVATKSDKLNKTNKLKSVELLENDPHIPEDVAIIPFSSENGEGKDELWALINEFIEFNSESLD